MQSINLPRVTDKDVAFLCGYALGATLAIIAMRGVNKRMETLATKRDVKTIHDHIDNHAPLPDSRPTLRTPCGCE